MLGRHRAAEGEDVPQRRFDDFLRSTEFFCIPRDEILVRMPITGVSVNDGLRESTVLGDRSCSCNRLPKFTIGHCPVSTNFPSPSIATSGSSLVHGRWNAVA